MPSTTAASVAFSLGTKILLIAPTSNPMEAYNA